LEDLVHNNAAEKFAAQLRIAAAHFIENTLRSVEHEVAGCRFRFRMSPDQFALANRLPAKAAARRFKQITVEAQERVAMTKRSALRAEFGVATVESRPDGSTTMLQITFKNFLRPVTPIPWDRIYKRIRLNAINVA